MAGVTLDAFGLPAWQELEEARVCFVEDVYARVVEWQFARDTAHWESPRPLLAERLGRKPVKAMKKEPKDWSRVMRYGLDGNGKVVCAQSFSDGSGPTAQMYTEGLAVEIDGWRVYLTFDVSSPPARLSSVTVEEHADGQLSGTTMIIGSLQTSFSRERYSYDDADRLLGVVSHNVAYGVIESWTEQRVIYAADGSVKRIAERELKPGEAPRGFDEHTVAHGEQESVTAEQAQTAQRRLERSLSGAIVAWHERVKGAGECRRILLLYPGPGNPPLPPGLATRNDPLTPGTDPMELFDPDPAGAILDPEPAEFDVQQLQADCDLLNTWYDEQQDNVDPVELLIAVAQRARSAISKRAGQNVWVLPVDDDRDGLMLAIRAILPTELQHELGLAAEGI